MWHIIIFQRIAFNLITWNNHPNLEACKKNSNVFKKHFKCLKQKPQTVKTEMPCKQIFINMYCNLDLFN